jgi:F0F1-type ATP synthase membrane subunit b/b'
MRRRAFFLLVSALVLAWSVPASAAESPDERNPAEQPIGEVFRWMNFALVFGAGGYLIAKKAPGFFRSRADAISAAIMQAAAAKAEADREFAEAEGKLARLDQEVAALREAARREAAEEAERIRKLTGEEAEKIARAGRGEIEAAERAAEMELRALAAKLAVERAEALLTREMTPKAQDELFRALVASLPGRSH